MTFKVVCDNCGEESKCPTNHRGDPINPTNPKTHSRWYSRTIKGVTQHACSRECLEEIGGLVLPV